MLSKYFIYTSMTGWCKRPTLSTVHTRTAESTCSHSVVIARNRRAHTNTPLADPWPRIPCTTPPPISELNKPAPHQITNATTAHSYPHILNLICNNALPSYRPYSDIRLHHVPHPSIHQRSKKLHS